MPRLPPSALALLAAAGAPRRPNPAGEAPWAIVFRHAEGGPWVEVDRAWTREGAEEELVDGASRWSVRASPGDLVRIVGPDGDWTTWGLALDGVCRRLPPDPFALLGWEAQDWARRYGWPELWEECPNPSWLVRVAARLLPRRDLVRAACDCARLALPWWTGPSIVPEALEAAEAWARGEGSAERVQEARDRAGAVVVSLPRSDASRAGFAILHAVDVALGPVGYWAAETTDAVVDLLAQGGPHGPVKARLVEVVRARLPLALVVTALSRRGARDR